MGCSRKGRNVQAEKACTTCSMHAVDLVLISTFPSFGTWELARAIAIHCQALGTLQIFKNAYAPVLTTTAPTNAYGGAWDVDDHAMLRALLTQAAVSLQEYWNTPWSRRPETQL